MLKRNLLVGLMLGAMASASAQSLATWTKFKNITVNTKASGAGVAVNTVNFPVLVRLDSTNAADVFTGALAGGADIRFSNAAGVERPFEIEHWDAAAKRASIWVLADTVKGNDSIASLRIYWGRAGVSSASNGAAVFDTTNGYVAVWHLNGTTTETSVTAHGFVATPPVDSTPTVVAAGAIGAARRFSGTQYLRAIGSAPTALNLPLNGKYSLSAWVRNDTISTTGTNTGHAIVTKGDHQYALAVFGATAAERNYEIATKAGNNQWRQATTAAITTPVVYAGVKANDHVGQWRYVSGSWNGADSLDTARVYFQGAFQKLTTWNNTSTTGRQEARDVHIGVLSNEGTGSTNPTGTLQRFHVGSLDEIRISKVLRDSTWMRLEYATQNPAGSVVALGSTQTQTVTPTAITNVRYNNVGTGNTPRDTLFFTVNVPVNKPLQFDGGPADSVKITSTTATMPAGITLNPATGLISGTPTAVFANANRTLTVYSSLGNVTRGLIVAVLPGPLAGLAYAQDTAQYIVGIAMNANAASWSATGRAPTGFSVTPALPAGITLNEATGAISGTPTAIAAAANYTVKAFNATDTVSKVIRFSVIAIGVEDYAGAAWPNKQVVYLNTQGNGAAVAATVTNFPVLVRLDSANFNTGFAQATSTGADIRFTKLNNTTRLSHQIERWDAVAKKAEVWVLVDSVKGNAISSLRMHWGNATAPNLSSGPTVFDTATGFQAVYHMSATTGNENDATANGFGATATSGPGSAVGIIGKARSFDGASQFFQVAGSASGRLNFSQADSYTLSSWINPTAIATTTNTGHKIIDKGDNQYVLATYGPDETTRYWEITIRGNNTWNQCQADGSFAGSTAVLASSSVNAWNHLVGTYTGGAVGAAVTQRLYYNGVLVNQCEITNSETTGRNEGVNVHIGVQSGAAPSGTYTRYWNGLLDEPRLHNRARSLDWVKLEFQNQRAAQTLVSFSAPTSIGSHNAANVLAQGFAVKSAGQGLSFQMNNAAEGKAVMTLVDMSGRAVWSGAFAPGATQLVWNGTVKGGVAANSGLYVARLTVLNKQGQTIQAYDRKVPYTR